MIGGLHRVLYMHLHRGEEGRLAGRAGELLRWATCFPPAELGAEPRRRRGATVSGRWAEGRADPQERILRAFAAAAGEHGLARTTVGQIAAGASVSHATFYEHFENKEDALAAALDLSGAQLAAVALPAARRAAEWPQAVRRALAAVCGFLAAEPAFARLRAIEAYAAGPAAVELRDRPWRQILGELLPEEAWRGPGALATEAGFGAIYALVSERVRGGELEELARMAPLLTYITLSPLLGAEAAGEVAREER